MSDDASSVDNWSDVDTASHTDASDVDGLDDFGEGCCALDRHSISTVQRAQSIDQVWRARPNSQPEEVGAEVAPSIAHARIWDASLLDINVNTIMQKARRK